MGAIEYLAWIGQTFGSEFASHYAGNFTGRRLHLKQGMKAIQEYEFGVSRAVINALQEIPGLHIHGLTDLQRLDERVPTVSFTLPGWHPRQLVEKLAAQNIYVWDGNYYALAVTERLGVEDKGGMLRVGPVHYNTLDEVAHLEKVLGELVKGRR